MLHDDSGFSEIIGEVDIDDKMCAFFVLHVLKVGV